MNFSPRQSLPKSFLVAARGIALACREQRNLRIQLVLTVAVLALGATLRLDRIEWVILCILIGCVLTAELLNTAIETVVDLVSPEHHPLAGKAKDIASGAVLLISLIAAGMGMTVFLPHLIQRLS